MKRSGLFGCSVGKRLWRTSGELHEAGSVLGVLAPEFTSWGKQNKSGLEYVYKNLHFPCRLN